MYEQSSTYGYYHEAVKSHGWAQQEQHQPRPAESLFSIVMDDFRNSGLLHNPHMEFPQQHGAGLQALHQRHIGESVFQTLEGLDDMALHKLLHFTAEEPSAPEEDFSLTGPVEPRETAVLEPTPLNIPDSHNVALAQATGQFYVMNHPLISQESNAPEPILSRSLDFALSMDHAGVSHLDEQHQRNLLGFQQDSQEAELGNEEVRFRLYQSELWNKRFQDLVDYQKRTGNCQVPLTYIEDPALARWVKRQRYQYKLMLEGKSSTMTAERVKALEDIGFVWDSQGSAWWDRFAELVEFKRVHKHCNVPSKFSENPPLAVWVKCQRRQYKLFKQGEPSNITPQRIRDLESIGFQWLLRSYHRKTGSNSN